MKISMLALGLFASTLLAACGGGGTGYGGPGTSTPPVTAPLSTATLNGGAAFVTSTNMAVYTFGGDTVANQSTCTGGCLAVWPAVPAGSASLPSPWASFTRTDNGAVQLSYKGQALYTFANDTPGTASGEGVHNFHLARP